ncbi:MAG: Amuc_1098 family type IV pilus outer membrane protein [Akkermansiaceae bacterium]
MEKLCFAYQRHLARAGIACVLTMSAPLFVSEANAQESVVQKELNRRINSARKAHDLLKSGDVFYQKGNYAKAVTDYSQAFDLLPSGSMSHEMRHAAANRYATAATEHARQLAKTGSYDKARNLLKTVTSPKVAPAHMGALKLLGQVDDPIRYNHALTPAHVKNIHKVGRLLREAEGFHSLGQYDRADTVYKEVIRIDPYNKAARRGMEKVAATKSDYLRAGRDHGRAAMLSEVDRQWELKVPPANSSLPTAPGTTLNNSFAPDLREKLASISVDNVALENASLEEAIDFVRIQSRLGDIPDPGGEQAGVNIIVNLGDPDNDKVKLIRSARVTLKARGLPLTKILEYVTDQTHTQWRTDGVSVMITPRGSTDTALVTRKFRVPPNFLSSSAVKDAANNDDNPFGDDDDNEEGKIAKKMSITDFLKRNGISFPEGSSAIYTRSTNTLIVKNTPTNIDIVDQLVSLITEEEPVMVVVKTTIIRVGEERLKELSFDWLITPWAIGSRGFSLGGGSTGNGSAIIDIPTNPIATSLTSPITSGLRSGNSGAQTNAIDTYLNSPTTGIARDTNIRAPGILKVTGIFSGVQVQMMMRGLDNQKGVDVMVKPSVIARSGERATVELIRELIYPTEYEPPELPNSVGIGADNQGNQQFGGGAIFPVTPANPTAFETRNTGVTLEVEPTVGPNKRFIELSLKPEFVEHQGFINYGSPISTPVSGPNNTLIRQNITDNRILMPVFRVLRMQNSTLTIQDGATIVLGGLMTTSKSKVEDKVPLLGDIPLAGRLFRSESEQTLRQAVVVMVTAELVDPTGQPWRKR